MRTLTTDVAARRVAPLGRLKEREAGTALRWFVADDSVGDRCVEAGC